MSIPWKEALVRAGFRSSVHLVKSGIKRWLILIPEGKTLRLWFRV
jgi:hypothetical protein